MPILYWIFTASFLAGLVRIVLSVLGAVFFTYVGHEFVTGQLVDMANGSAGGNASWGAKLSAIFTRAGIMEAFDVILAGISARILLSAFSGIRLGRT